MGIFGTLFQTAVHIVVLPISAGKDLLDLAAGEDANNTIANIQAIKEDLDEITDNNAK